jgi:HSP20 family protein
MTNLVRRDPFSDLRSTMRWFDEGFSRPWRFVVSPTTEYSGTFPVEVSETEDGLDVKAMLPGVKPEEVEITVANDVLTIKAAHKAESETKDEKRDYYRREIRYGSYQRSMNLPVSVDADKAEASFENGQLTLHLPKAEALRPKQIKVSTPTAAIPAAETPAETSETPAADA